MRTYTLKFDVHLSAVADLGDPFQRMEVFRRLMAELEDRLPGGFVTDTVGPVTVTYGPITAVSG